MMAAAQTRAQLQAQLRAAQKRQSALEALLPDDVFRRPGGTRPYADGDRYMGGFGVESDSRPGVFYKVCFDTATGYWVCSCPAGIHRGKCKHMDRYGLAGRAAVERTQRPVPTPRFEPTPLDAQPLPTMPKALVSAPRRRFMSEDEV